MREKTTGPSCGKRTQRDYSLAFKLQVIDEVEKGSLSYKEAQGRYGIQGRSTVLVWLRKHGSLDWQSNSMKGKKTPQQQIKDLEKRIKRLEQEKIILNKAIDVADEMFDTNIRKKYLPLSQAAFDSQGQQESEAPEQ
jgi:transposase-like protein